MTEYFDNAFPQTKTSDNGPRLTTWMDTFDIVAVSTLSPGDPTVSTWHTAAHRLRVHSTKIGLTVSTRQDHWTVVVAHTRYTSISPSVMNKQLNLHKTSMTRKFEEMMGTAPDVFKDRSCQMQLCFLANLEPTQMRWEKGQVQV